MSNSSLVSYTKLSPNCSTRTDKITKITIHHTAVVNASLAGLGNGFANPAAQASANYGIDCNGNIGMFVEEKNRAWTSSNRDNDNRAVTIEVANSSGAPNWQVSDKALSALIDLCVDICKRNGIPRLNHDGTKNGSLTLHEMFAATLCPGPYIKSKIKYICDEVNKRLVPSISKPSSGVMYQVVTGSFSVKANAEKRVAELKAKGFDSFVQIKK